VRLRVKEEVREGAAIGDGPVDAVCKAISSVTRTSAKLVKYEIQAVTSGTEAMGEVTVRLEEAGRKVVGRGASTDVIEASAKAYIDGLNKLAAVSAASA
jgi:2-isopropylmalate synthase